MRADDDRSDGDAGRKEHHSRDEIREPTATKPAQRGQLHGRGLLDQCGCGCTALERSKKRGAIRGAYAGILG